MVERLVLARADRLGDRLVPFLAVGEDRIDVEDHAAEIEHPVAHDVADREAGKRHVDLACPMGDERSSEFMASYLGLPRLGKAGPLLERRPRPKAGAHAGAHDPAERWLSGRKHRTRNAAYGQPYRGFESHPLRQSSVQAQHPETDFARSPGWRQRGHNEVRTATRRHGLPSCPSPHSHAYSLASRFGTRPRADFFRPATLCAAPDGRSINPAIKQVLTIFVGRRTMFPPFGFAQDLTFTENKYMPKRPMCLRERTRFGRKLMNNPCVVAQET